MAKYWEVIKISFKDLFLYRAKLLAYVFVWSMRLWIIIFLYAYAYKYISHTAQVISYQTAAWSMAMYFVTIALGARNVYTQISDEVRLGTIETKLNKPFNYILYKVFEGIGSGLPVFIFMLVVSVLFLSTIVGFPQVNTSALWFFQSIGVVLLGFINAFLVYIIVGLTAFWLQKSEPVFWIVDKSIIILGGAYIPVALLPNFIQLIAKYSPVGATMFVTYIFNPDFSSQFLNLFICQFIWIIILGTFVVLIFRRATEKLSINGG